MALVGVLWSLENIVHFANTFFDGANFPEYIVFVDLENNLSPR